MKVQSLIAFVTLAVSANAHTIFQAIGVNGVMEERYNYMRLPEYDGPIEDVTHPAMACNGGPNPLKLFSPNVKEVKAGDQITMFWSHTLTSPETNAIDASHKGPILAYLAKVPDALGPIPSNGWFKIYEDGYNNGVWAVDKLIANNGKVTVTIPPCIPPGDYLFRGELIALHAAGNYPGAQLYMECAQLRVTAGGSTLPSSTVSFPGAYKGTDPGIKFNLYTPNIQYTIPGPEVFTCSGNGGSQPQPTTPAPAPTTTTRPQTSATPAPTTAAPPATTTPASGPAAGKWAQCGGINHTGPTTCVEGSTCVKLNDYYHQCQ